MKYEIGRIPLFCGHSFVGTLLPNATPMSAQYEFDFKQILKSL